MYGYNNESQNNYIVFKQNDINEKMSSNGSFDFKFNYSLTSDTFTANGTSITIQTVSYLYDSSTRTETKNKSKKFVVKLCKTITNKEVGRYYGSADGVYGGLEFTGLTKGAKYYFIMAPLDGNFHLGPYYFQGHGKVDGVTVK